MYKKILVPVDGSRLAEAVLPHAQALAKSEGAEIILLRVPALPSAAFAAQDPALASLILEDMDVEAGEYIETEVDRLQKQGSSVSGIVRRGMVADTILEVAEETHADVIVMSTHGRSGIQRWLIGSVADRVVHYSHVPVMLIRPFSNN